MNSFKNNNRRGRFKSNGDRNFRRNLAREALSNGDKILSENYLQHAEHFSRILMSQENAKNLSENLTEATANNQIKAEIENKETEEPKID